MTGAASRRRGADAEGPARDQHPTRWEPKGAPMADPNWINDECPMHGLLDRMAKETTDG